MQHPVHLIRVTGAGPDSRFELVEESAQAIRDATAKLHGGVRVVAAIGALRNGKSSLMNRLFHHPGSHVGQPAGFAVAHSIVPQTKGVWAWVKPLDDSSAMVLLDTEGMHDNEARDGQKDARLFALAMVLSSVLLYNLRHYPDMKSLDDLAAITPQARALVHAATTSDGKTGMAPCSALPKLHVVLRDFHLTTRRDKVAWLRELMSPPDDVTSPTFNGKMLLTSGFPEADLSTIPLPGCDAAALEAGNNGCEDFRASLQQLCEALHTGAPLKRVMGNPIASPAAFLDYACAVVATANEAKPIVLQDALSNAVRLAADRAGAAAEAAFFEVTASAGPLPLADDAALSVLETRAVDAAVKVFMGEALFTSDEDAQTSLQSFLERLDEFIDALENENDAATDALVGERLASFFDAIDASEAAHRRPGGAADFATLHASAAADFARGCHRSGVLIAERSNAVTLRVQAATARLAAVDERCGEADAAALRAAQDTELAGRALAAASAREARAAASSAAADERFVQALQAHAVQAQQQTDALVQQQKHETEALSERAARERAEQAEVLAATLDKSAKRNAQLTAEMQRRSEMLQTYFAHTQKMAVDTAKARTEGVASMLSTLVETRKAMDQAAAQTAVAQIEAEAKRPDPVRDALLKTASGVLGALGDGILAKMRDGDTPAPAAEPKAAKAIEDKTPSDSGGQPPAPASAAAAASEPPRSFAEAFAHAHNELGPGHTFEWRGKKYTTDRADGRNMQGKGTRLHVPSVPPPSRKPAAQRPAAQGRPAPAVSSSTAAPGQPAPPASAPAPSSSSAANVNTTPDTDAVMSTAAKIPGYQVVAGPSAMSASQAGAYGTSVEVDPAELEKQPSAGVTLLKEVTGYADAERAVDHFKQGDYLAGAISSGMAVASVIPVAKGFQLGYKGARFGIAKLGSWICRARAPATAAASSTFKVTPGAANALHTARYEAATLSEQIAQSSLPTLSKESMHTLAKTADLHKPTLTRLTREYGPGAWEKTSYALKNTEGVARAEVHMYVDHARKLIVEPKFKNVKFPK